MASPTVVISNGNSKFILGTAAAEAHARGMLVGFVTAGYPTERLKKLLKLCPLQERPILGRLLAREEALPGDLIHPIWTSELFFQMARACDAFPGARGLVGYFDEQALRKYGYLATRVIRNVRSGIYHYRSGYGLESVVEAKKRGMVALCDHSIAHPALLEYLVANDGRLPPKGTSLTIAALWNAVLEDVDQADHVVVNSDFVKQTFLHQGWDDARVHVIYTGIDDEFVKAIPSRPSAGVDHRRQLRLLFAGAFCRRKGAEVLVRALQQCEQVPWRLEIVGVVDPQMERAYGSFLHSDRVVLTGTVPRLELANRMAAADVFVFPSLAEGSARVIFMALACGCYVITTPNAGSIVEDEVHGHLIRAGDAGSLVEAITRAAKLQPQEIEEVGMRNATVIRQSYSQAQYGEHLAELYKRLA